jgi:hypothetical protein
MSDDLPDGEKQASIQTDMKERAEFISGVFTTLLEEEGYESAVAHARKFFASNTPEQMERNETSLHLTCSRIHDPRRLLQAMTASRSACPRCRLSQGLKPRPGRLVPAICVADAVLARRLLDPFKFQVRHEWTLG